MIFDGYFVLHAIQMIYLTCMMLFASKPQTVIEFQQLFVLIAMKLVGNITAHSKCMVLARNTVDWYCDKINADTFNAAHLHDLNELMICSSNMPEMECGQMVRNCTICWTFAHTAYSPIFDLSNFRAAFCTRNIAWQLFTLNKIVQIAQTHTKVHIRCSMLQCNKLIVCTTEVCTTIAHVYECVIAVATMQSSGALWQRNNNKNVWANKN